VFFFSSSSLFYFFFSINIVFPDQYVFLFSILFPMGVHSLSPTHISPPTNTTHTIKKMQSYATQIIISMNGASSSCSSGQFLSYCLIALHALHIAYIQHFNSTLFHSLQYDLLFNKSSIWIYNIYIEKKDKKNLFRYKFALQPKIMGEYCACVRE
jgi:hypothetical protein